MFWGHTQFGLKLIVSVGNTSKQLRNCQNIMSDDRQDTFQLQHSSKPNTDIFKRTKTLLTVAGCKVLLEDAIRQTENSWWDFSWPRVSRQRLKC